MTIRLAAVLAVLLLAWGTLADDSAYRIGVDDVLDVGVWNFPELQKTVPVRPDGKISLPLVNDVIAAGLTPMELRRELTAKISEFVQRPDVSVVVREIRSLKVSVLGHVREPGRYDIKGPSTVFDALALAGGLTEFASRRKITILRTTDSTIERLRFDYDAAIANPASANGSLTIQAGDVVVVP